MKLIRQIRLVLLALILNSVANAQSDSIDLFVKDIMQMRKIPGLQLAIVKDGRIVKKGNYGFANVQDSILVSNKTVFPINSITKAFTGVAILQLVEAGKLNLSSPVSAYLTDLPVSWREVTVQQLLSHTSGIPDIVDEEESGLIGANPDDAWQKVTKLDNGFKPGEKFSYNQTNYLLLGRIINKLSGMPFQEFITTRQLQKAGMTKTIQAGFGATKDIVANSAGGYRYTQGKLINMFFSFPAFLQTAGGMSSTAPEIGHWVISLQTNGLLLQRSSLGALWTPALLTNGKIAGFGGLLNGYAAGWPVMGRNEHPAAAAAGGGRSAVVVYPEDNLSVIVLSNLAGAFPETFIDEIAGFFIADMKESNGFGLSAPVNQLRINLEKAGFRNAITEAGKLGKKNRAFILAEPEVNNWGYKLLRQNKIADALEIFKLNVFLYPASSNAFDSLGEIYAENGDREQAIKNYEQSIKLDPQNKNAAEQLKRLKTNKL